MPLRHDPLAACTTLGEALTRRVEASGGAPWLTLYSRDRVVCRLTFGELLQGATAWGAHLRELGVQPGDSVLMVLPTGRAFYEAYWGLLWVGAVPVPIYPPVRMGRLEDYLANFAALRRDCGARVVITDDLVRPVLRGEPGAEGRPATYVLPSEVAAQGVATRHPGRAADLALLQYTSGSTGQQKGVMLSHGNLLANLRAIGAGVDARPEDVAVSWLPLYHDMGLIGLMMGSVYLGLPLVATSPVDFLRRPVRWLRMLSEHRGSLSAGPNFAFSLVARKVRERDLEGLDLNNWRLALCGAEPIHAATVETFTRRFEGRGFRPSAFFPAYGLAENSLAVSFSDLDSPPRIERLVADALEERGAVVRSTGGEGSRQVVSVGKPLETVDVEVRDPAGRTLGEASQGEVVVRGPSVMEGYLGNPEATQRTIREGWLFTGDLGFLLDGRLYISGRSKDLVIKAGRNYFAEDLEAAAAGVPGVRPGGLCAFSVQGDERGTEEVVFVAELAVGVDPGGLDDRLRQRVLQATGCRLDEVLLVAPHTLPKTSSGKIQRFQARRWFLDGSLTRRGGERRTAGLGTYLKAWVRDKLHRS